MYFAVQDYLLTLNSCFNQENAFHDVKSWAVTGSLCACLANNFFSTCFIHYLH